MSDFTAEEKERLKKLFDRIDADKDGKIKAADFKKLAAEFGRDMTDERANVRVINLPPSWIVKPTQTNYYANIASLILILIEIVISFLECKFCTLP